MDDDGLVQSLDSMQKVLHRRDLEAQAMLEKAFRKGQSVSSDNAKALDDGISKVHGVQCTVRGECEYRTSAVLYRRRCSANYATIAELLCPVQARCR